MRQLDRRLDRVGGVADLVVALVIGLQAAQDLDRILDRRLVDVDLLESPDQCPVLLKIVAVFLVGGRADAADGAAGKRRLQQVGGVHRAAAGRAGADLAAIAGAGQQRAHVEREDGRVLKHLGHLAMDDAPRQPLGDRGLADPGIADIERVVLGAPAEDLDRPLDLGLAPDQRVDLAALGLLVEVDAIGVERVMAALLALLAALLFFSALDAARLGAAGRLGDAMRDVVDRVEAGHVLLLQEVDGVALALGEHRDQYVGTGDLLATRGLHMDRSALQHALEARGRLCILAVIGDEVGQLVIDIGQHLAAQPVEIDAAGSQHRDRILVLGEGQQQMLERRILVTSLIRVGECAMQRFFEVA